MSLTPDLQREIAIGWQRHQAGKWDEAARHYRKVLKAAPDNEHALHLLGLVKASQGLYSEAVDLYRQALKRVPNDAKLWNNLSLAYASQRSFREAADAMTKAIELGNPAPDALGMLVSYRREICDWTHYTQDLAIITASATVDGPRVLPGFTTYIDDPALQLAAGMRKCALDGLNVGAARQRHLAQQLAGLPAPSPTNRIRIAYVSADFRDHPVTQLMAEALRSHDRTRFEVFAVSIGPKDAFQSRISDAVEHFWDCSEEPPEKTAVRLRRAGIDIAVDVMGHTTGSRLEIFAGRPAPVQVTYLGYPATTGADFLDYIVVDPFIVPMEEAASFSEKIVHLPETYLPNAALTQGDAQPASRADEGLPEGAVVFCAFNAAHKFDPNTFGSWMRILREVPDSVLWLRSHACRENLEGAALDAGVEPTRLIFANRVDEEQHHARIALADLFLDTFPYTAHTTAGDMLRQGVPFVTRAGRSFASRVAASFAQLLSLDEMITYDQASFEARAVALAHNPDRLRDLRIRLSGARFGSPLFDPVRYCRHLEAAFELMHRRRLTGLDPTHLTVEALPR